VAAIYAALWFDAEDYVTPETDDVTKALAETLTELAIPATFKFVGQRARVLRRRGRTDVITAMQPHDIGYHTNFHSAHPTVAEYCAELDLEAGARAFVDREGPGARDVAEIFGKPPACYGQPGGSWAPQQYLALRELNIPLNLDEGSHLGLDDRPFWFMGVPNVYRMRSRCVRHYPRREDPVPEALARLDDALAHSRSGDIISIYYHPCEFSTKQFWDGVNFARGANPDLSQLQPPETWSAAESRRLLADFRRFIVGVKERGVDWVTATDLAELLGPESPEPQPSAQPAGLLRELAAKVAEEVTFHFVGGRWWSAAEALEQLAGALHGYQLVGKLERQLSASQVSLGPPERAPSLSRELTVALGTFMAAVGEVAEELQQTGQVPSRVLLGELEVPPASLAQAAAYAYMYLAEHMRLPGEITLRPVELTAEKFVARDEDRPWSWSIFPPDFSAPNLLQMARLQCWTLKPATTG